MIQVIIVDDHRLFRMGLKLAINANYSDIVVAGEAECGKELFKILPSTPADVILLDINLPDMDGITITRHLCANYPAIKILAISAENDIKTVTSMIEAGANGFISKQKSDDNELARAIRTVASGLEYFGSDISSIIFGVYVAKKKTTNITDEFSDREREVILACRDGLIGKEIAERLGLSINTINTHKKRIFQKLGINSTIEMVQYALKNGIVKIE
jgi:DNA-binding NarL/FixJ family response regulator